MSLKKQKKAKNRNALAGKIVRVRSGVAIYKVNLSPFWRVRVWIPSQKRNIVRSTKCESRVDALQAAEEFYKSLGTRSFAQEIQKEKTYSYYADKLIKLEIDKGKRGECSPKLWNTTKLYLTHRGFGSEIYFGEMDVSKITEKDYRVFFSKVRTEYPALKSVTYNFISSTFNKVMNLAYADGVIDRPIKGERVKSQPSSRTFFRFFPIVEKQHDEWKKLLKSAKQLATENVTVYHTPITGELYDLIMFLCHSFCRPTISELYALRFSDITILNDPKTLLVTYRKGKTGRRQSPTTEFCVRVFQRIRERYKDTNPEDYIFLPNHKNREHAKRVFQKQFRYLLERSDLLVCKVTNQDRSLYSLRHTSLQMRFVKSKGTVSARLLARAAGTSESQLDAHYLRENLITKDLIENLQSFGPVASGDDDDED